MSSDDLEQMTVLFNAVLELVDPEERERAQQSLEQIIEATAGHTAARAAEQAANSGACSCGSHNSTSPKYVSGTDSDTRETNGHGELKGYEELITEARGHRRN